MRTCPTYQRNPVDDASACRREVCTSASPDGVLASIFWHTVEFSRSGRASNWDPSIPRRGNLSKLGRAPVGVKPRSVGAGRPRRASPRPAHASPARGRRTSCGGVPPGDRPPRGVRSSLAGVENSTSAPWGRQVRGCRCPPGVRDGSAASTALADQPTTTAPDAVTPALLRPPPPACVSPGAAAPSARRSSRNVRPPARGPSP